MIASDSLLPPVLAVRLDAYLDRLVPVLRQPVRGRMARAYCLALLAAPGRKSVEPLAGLHGAGHGSGLYQSLHHFVADARWDDAALLAAVAREVLPAIERPGPIRAWIVDDTALAKKGRHSVGVAQQYSGRLGTTTNCQVAVSLSLANAAASLPMAWRLYLPESWAADHERSRAAGVPLGIRFQTKIELALAQLAAAAAVDLPRGVVLADEAYGGAAQFRDGARALGLDYAVAIDRAQGLLLDNGKGPLAARAAAHLCPQRRGTPCRAARSTCAMPPCGCGQPLTVGRARGVAFVRARPGQGYRGALLARQPAGQGQPGGACHHRHPALAGQARL